MVDIGYYEQIEGGIFGTANPATDSNPEARSALQAQYAAMAAARTTVPGYIPPNYLHQGGGALPRVGWTAQKNGGTPVFPPYTPTGHIPDWTGDSNPAGAGAYDMTPVRTDYVVNPLNRAPVGEDFHNFFPPNPNTPPNDVGGSSGTDLEY